MKERGEEKIGKEWKNEKYRKIGSEALYDYICLIQQWEEGDDDCEAFFDYRVMIKNSEIKTSKKL